jgi:hypothetical protein
MEHATNRAGLDPRRRGSRRGGARDVARDVALEQTTMVQGVDPTLTLDEATRLNIATAGARHD